MTEAGSNRVEELLAANKEYDPFTQTQKISLRGNFRWGLKIADTTNTYTGRLARITSTGPEPSDAAILTVSATTFPTSSTEAAKSAGQALMLSQLVILADQEPITLENNNESTPDVSVVGGGTLYEMSWEGQFVFGSPEQLRAIAFAENLEIRAYSQSGYFDLDDEDEAFIHRSFKLFYNQAYDEDAFSSELESLYSEHVRSSIRNLTKSVERDGCFVATAAYGTYDHPDLDALRYFRDSFLRRHLVGRAFIRSYYQWGPEAAKALEGRNVCRRIIRAPVHLFASLIRIACGLSK